MAAKTTREEANILAELQNENSLKSIFEDKFDSKSYANKIVQYQAVGETLGKLASSIEKLDHELYSQVVSHHEDLLSQATGIESLEGVLVMMASRVATLKGTFERVSTRVSAPYSKIQERTLQLSRLQAACDLLRKVIRMLYLMKRLKSLLLGGHREIAKVAQTFSEIDQLLQGSDLVGIQVIEEDKAWLMKARRDVESQAKKMLSQGLELSNPAQVGVAVQVFQSMGLFQSVLLSHVEECKETIQKQIQEALDPSTLAPPSTQGGGSQIPGRAATMPTVGSTASWRATLWTRLETLADQIERTYLKVQQLQMVLEKKRDPVSQLSLLDQIKETQAHKVLMSFWSLTVDNLAVEFAMAAKVSPFLNQTFEADYPRLVLLFVRLLQRLDQQMKGSGHTSQSTGDRKDKEIVLMKAFTNFEKTYLSKSLSKLFDNVNQMFSSSARGPPGEQEVGSFVRSIALELSGSLSSEQVSLLIAKNVSKSLKLFVMKCEQMMTMGQSSMQLVSPPNEAQMRNITISNTVHCLASCMNEEIFGKINLCSTVLECLMDTMKGVVEQRDRFLGNLLDELRKYLEAMLIRIHEEDFGSDRSSSAMESQCSEYIKEIQSFITRISTEFITKFRFIPDARQHLHSVAYRVIDVFVRNVCLVRPLSENGRLRITADVAQLEFALAPLCAKTSDLGAHAKMLQGLRHLLFLTAPDITSQESKGLLEFFPLSYIILHLVSRAPSTQVQSPLQIHGWSVEEFSKWLDSHQSEEERLAAVKTSLDQLVSLDSSLADLQKLHQLRIIRQHS